MAWQRVMPLAELPVGTAKARRLGRDDLLVCRPDGDRIHVVEDNCSHADMPLGDQELSDDQVVCPCHGARFDIVAGAVLKGPAPVGIDVFPVRIHEDWVEVELEDAP